MTGLDLLAKSGSRGLLIGGQWRESGTGSRFEVRDPADESVPVGGSLVDHSGHNILEPAMYGKPIVFGPYMQNFKEIAQAFIENGAAIQVQSDRELDESLLTLLSDPVLRARLGAAARALVEANRGAKDKTLAVIADLLPPSGADAAGRPGVAGVVRPFRRVH